MWGGLKALPSAEDIRGLLPTPQSLVAWETNVIQTFFLTLPCWFLIGVTIDFWLGGGSEAARQVS